MPTSRNTVAEQPPCTRHDHGGWMNALEVLQQIVRRCDLGEAALTLVSHPTRRGWRQRHPTAEERLGNLSGAPATSPPAGIQVRGGDLLELGLPDLDRYRSLPDHVVSISSLLGGAA